MDWYHILTVCILILHDTTGQHDYRSVYFIYYTTGKGNSFLVYEDEYDDALDYHSPHLGLSYGRLFNFDIGWLINTYNMSFR